MLFVCLLMLGCQSLPSAQEGRARDVVFVQGETCLSDYAEDLKRVHYGPCLRVVSIDDRTPAVRGDGFVEVPAGERVTLGVQCVYRHQDGTLQQDTPHSNTLIVEEDQFSAAGERWYLNIRDNILRASGCRPTLSRSSRPPD
ncbi:hypothetical protein DYI22_13650 [Marinobacter lipolyticus]|nr:hypothetical protein [Marinobacter lipolyticus]